VCLFTTPGMEKYVAAQKMTDDTVSEYPDVKSFGEPVEQFFKLFRTALQNNFANGSERPCRTILQIILNNLQDRSANSNKIRAY